MKEETFYWLLTLVIAVVALLCLLSGCDSDRYASEVGDCIAARHTKTHAELIDAKHDCEVEVDNDEWHKRDRDAQVQP